MKIYLSGPMTGVEDYKARFDGAEMYLKKLYAGMRPVTHVQIVNPATVMSAMPVDLKWNQYMDVALSCLKGCDAIYMMDGWEKSTGAQIEKLYAEGSGIPVLNLRK
jgi:hypothetical protein